LLFDVLPEEERVSMALLDHELDTFHRSCDGVLNLSQRERSLLKSFYYTSVPSAFGTLRIVWRETSEGAKVRRLLLPSEGIPTEEALLTTRAGTGPVSNEAIEEVAEQLQSFLKGAAVDFQLDLIDLGACSEFQRRVLLAEHQIPRGWVSTYGRIARSLGMPTAARAVGAALSRNPFPIIIPCHRAIRSNGELGGFRGGLNMKRALLELEGVEFSATGKVLTSRFYY
jgi:methylated-DNA-[protein]-cysteine S-methyltransferase